MKNLKHLLIALIAVATLVACKGDDDNNDDVFLFSNTNIAGSHDLTFFKLDAEVRGELAGIPVTAIVTGLGDTFQTTINFNANGTFIVDGQFRIATETTIGGQTTPDSIIVNLDNETGSYSISSNADTITFSGIEPIQITTLGEGVTVDLIDGTWDVTLFNESELRLTKTESEVNGDTETDSTVEIRFIRQ